MPDKAEKECSCPSCGEKCSPSEIHECPGCDRPGCDYCMPAGKGCNCPECCEDEEDA